jgi:hypothetical protein
MFFPTYGTLVSIVTDNASVFCSKQVKDLCFRWGVIHITTTPYYPQALLAERVNKNLKATLKIFHHDSQGRWDEELAWLSMAFNTAFHESHKSTPDKLFLWRELRCPLKTQWNLAPENTPDDEAQQRLFWKEAYQHLVWAKKKVAQRYNLQRNPHQYQVGDTVMYRLNLTSSEVQNISAKLLLKWSRPVVIAKFVHPNIVLLANPVTGVIIRRAHVSQLKPSAV